jgi:dihydrofolate reductase
MPRLLVRSFGVSLDGFAAGPDQSLEHPLGVRGSELMDWFIPTRVWQQMLQTGETHGETGIDNEIAEQGFADMGAWILGRNMFGPVRGPWPDELWKGWWGDEPPYHVPVFVLTMSSWRSNPSNTGFVAVAGRVQWIRHWASRQMQRHAAATVPPRRSAQCLRPTKAERAHRTGCARGLAPGWQCQ